MTTANPRTDSFGRPWGPLGSAMTAHELPRTDYHSDYYDPEKPFETMTIAELLGVRRSNDLNLLVQYLRRKGIQAWVTVRYCHVKTTHFIKHKGRLYSCHRSQIQEKKSQ